MNGQVNEEEVPSYEDVPDTACLELLLQRDAGWTQESSAVDRIVASA